MKKRLIAFLSTGLMMFSLAACASNTPGTVSPSGTTSPSPATSPSPTISESAETSIIGQVTAISGSTITLALGTQSMPQGAEPDGTTGNMPSPSPDAPADVPGNISTKPALSGTMERSQVSSDGKPAPSGSGQLYDMKDPASDGGLPRDGLRGFTLTGETKTITISSETVIIVSGDGQETLGTVSDIAVDDILAVTMSGDTVTEITVTSFSLTVPSDDMASNGTVTAAPDEPASIKPTAIPR